MTRCLYRPYPFALAACAALSLAAGCGGGSTTSSKQGEVRLVNAVGNAGALDLYAGDAKIASAVAAASAGGYAAVDTGTPTLGVRLASSGASLASNAATAIEKGKRYTVLAYTSGGAVAETVLADAEAAPGGDAARLRVFNTASVEAGALDAYLSATDCLALAASNAVATNLTVTAPGAYATFGASASGTPYRLCVTGAGDSSDLRLDLPLTLARQQVTTVVLTATVGGALVDATLVEQQGAVMSKRNASARLRLVADAAAHATVDATVNGVVLATAVGSPTIGGYATVSAGTLTTSVRIGGVPVTLGALSAAAGSDQTLLVAGSAAAPTVTLLADDNRRSTSTASTSTARLRLVHGLNGLNEALTLDAVKRVATSVAFGAASPPVNVAAGSGIALEVTAPVAGLVYAATGTAAATLTAGSVYTLFVLGDAGAPVVRLSQDR